MSRNRSTKIKFPVFGFEVRLILSANVKRTGQRLRADLADAVAGWVTDPESSKRGWLVLPLEPDEGTIAHEASHAVRFMFNAHGAKIDNETYAYHLDFLVSRIHRFLKRGQ